MKAVGITGRGLPVTDERIVGHKPACLDHTAASLRRAHAAIEAGRVVGKIVLEGFA